MPLKKCRKRHIKYRKRKGNVRISQPKERQGELHDSLSLPFADLGLDLWCATHAPTGRFAWSGVFCMMRTQRTPGAYACVI